MAPPPPAALGAGVAGEGGFSLFPFLRGSWRGWESGLRRTPRGQSSGIPSFVRAARAARRPALRCGAPSPPRAGAPQPLRGPSPERNRVECRVLPPWSFPLAARGCVWCVCPPSEGGVGALCAPSPLSPPGCWSRGWLVEALLGVGVPCRRRGDPSWWKHSWSAACLLEYLLLRSPTREGAPEESWGEGAPGFVLMEASHF